MSDPHTRRLARIVAEYLDGWNERVEYLTRTTTHTRDCLNATRVMPPGQLKHHTCRCPKRVEARAKTIRQPALLVQLVSAAAKENPATGPDNSPGSKSQPESSPPGSLEALELLADIQARVHALYDDMAPGRPRKRRKLAHDMRALVMLAQTPEDAQNAADALAQLARRARVLLGHEAPMRVLADVSCGECGGALIVASDASSDVRCVGTDDEPSCGTIYRRYQWADLLANQGDEETAGTT